MRTNLFLVSLFLAFSVRSTVILGPVIYPDTGHSYFLLSESSWSAAQAEAKSLGGNLATINDAVENDWVFDTFSGGQKNLWIGLNDTNWDNIFAWADGSPFSYSNWGAGQPNLGSERWVLIIRGDIGGAGQVARSWHDVGDTATQVYGVVELNSSFCSPHPATATATVVNGFVVGATIKDYGCGYTDPPLVQIQGGGGAGATAAAIITNGFVSRLNITSAGCCYTNIPQIVIASPPFVPWLSIGVSRVKVTQHLVLGRNYVLESSVDRTNWTNVGPSFTATSETVTDEFEVETTVQFFRIRQLP